MGGKSGRFAVVRYSTHSMTPTSLLPSGSSSSSSSARTARMSRVMWSR